jgi:ABC-2 type transport system ATP-binding protein
MIHARKLARTYQTRTGPVEAVRGVDLDVEAGEIVGFLGPNGAGKTTVRNASTRPGCTG